MREILAYEAAPSDVWLLLARNESVLYAGNSWALNNIIILFYQVLFAPAPGYILFLRPFNLFFNYFQFLLKR